MKTSAMALLFDQAKDINNLSLAKATWINLELTRSSLQMRQIALEVIREIETGG